MAEDKGFWRRLFGKGKGKPDPEKEPTPQRPEREPAESPDDVPPPTELVAMKQEDPADRAALERSEEAGETQVLETAELKTDALGRIYANALLELAQESGSVDELADEVQALQVVFGPGSDLHQLMTNPAIGDADRKQIVRRVFEGKVSDLLFRFLNVVAEKGRLASLPEITAGFLLAVAEVRGQVEVEAFVARAMDDATASSVAQQIGQHLGKQVTVRQRVDESLIGGLKIKIGDKLIDASVASQLRTMKNKIIAASSGAKGTRGPGA